MISTKESKLASLKLLFSTNFDDNDLLSILEEAQDDLDLAIARISEGQTEQWEMKSKPKRNPSNRGRGRGGQRFRPQKTHSNPSQNVSQNVPRNVSEKIAQKKNRKVEHKNFNSKEADSNTSWAQLVKG